MGAGGKIQVRVVVRGAQVVELNGIGATAGMGSGVGLGVVIV